MKWTHEQAISDQNFMSKIARTYSSRRICDWRVMTLRIRIGCELELQHFVRWLTRVSPLIRIRIDLVIYQQIHATHTNDHPKSDDIWCNHLWSSPGSGMYFTGFKYQRMINHEENHIALYIIHKRKGDGWVMLLPIFSSFI